jgi:hypothetical protein
MRHLKFKAEFRRDSLNNFFSEIKEQFVKKL